MTFSHFTTEVKSLEPRRSGWKPPAARPCTCPLAKLAADDRWISVDFPEFQKKNNLEDPQKMMCGGDFFLEVVCFFLAPYFFNGFSTHKTWMMIHLSPLVLSWKSKSTLARAWCFLGNSWSITGNDWKPIKILWFTAVYYCSIYSI